LKGSKMEFNYKKKRFKQFDVKIEMFECVTQDYSETPIFTISFYAENRNILMKELKKFLKERNIDNTANILCVLNRASTVYTHTHYRQVDNTAHFISGNSLYRVTFKCITSRVSCMPPKDRVNNKGENILEKRLRQAYGDLLLYRYSKAREVANNSSIVVAARNHLKEELLKNTAVEPFKDTALRIDFNRAKKITIELSKFVRLDFKAEYKFDKTALDVKFKVLNIIYYGNAIQELPPINDSIDEEIVERAEETAKIYEEIISLLKKNA
jgi:hypothetical protein